MLKMLYHVDLGFPLGFKYPDKMVFPLTWGAHALQQAREDRYGHIRKRDHIKTSEFTPIEVEINSKRETVKMLLRSKKEIDGNNLCIVVMPIDDGSWFVKTVWYNKADDTHKTLDKTKYLIPAFSIKKVLDKSY